MWRLRTARASSMQRVPADGSNYTLTAPLRPTSRTSPRPSQRPRPASIAPATIQLTPSNQSGGARYSAKRGCQILPRRKFVSDIRVKGAYRQQLTSAYDAIPQAGIAQSTRRASHRTLTRRPTWSASTSKNKRRASATMPLGWTCSSVRTSRATASPASVSTAARFVHPLAAYDFCGMRLQRASTWISTRSHGG